MYVLSIGRLELFFNSIYFYSFMMEKTTRSKRDNKRRIISLIESSQNLRRRKMKQITFEDIYILGNIIAENNLYKHYHYPEMLIRYDSNFIDFTSIPSLENFQAAESYLWDYHVQRGQHHVKFYFPENQKPTDELMHYLIRSGYDVGFLELYAIQPNQFPSVETNADIDIQIVTEENIDILIDLQYKSDLEFGMVFAKEQAQLTKRQFKNPVIKQVLALYKGIPAGYVELIIAADT